jgi:hypothetical protein
MRNLFIVALVAASAVSIPALADEQHYLGLQFDAGAPDGANLGIVAHPYIQWLRVGVSGSYNYLSPGIRGEITLDPIQFPVALTLTGDAGYFWPGSVPHLNNSPSFSYSYFNLQPGLEFGRRNRWRLFLRGGISFIDAKVSHIVINNDPTFLFSDAGAKVVAAPSAKLGFCVLF